jgi:hypothetical protein
MFINVICKLFYPTLSHIISLNILSSQWNLSTVGLRIGTDENFS